LKSPILRSVQGSHRKASRSWNSKDMSLMLPQPLVDVSPQKPDEAVAEVSAAVAIVEIAADVIIDRIVSRFMSRVTFHRALSTPLPSRLPFRDLVSN
jgi:hypothetical protein